MDSTAVRAHLIAALEANLVGPFYPSSDPRHGREVLRSPPSRWYLTGFLAPHGAREQKADEEAEDQAEGSDELGEGCVEDEAEETSTAEPVPKQRRMFPSSLGVSVLLPPPDAGGSDTLEVTLSFAQYIPEVAPEVPDNTNRRRPKLRWRRQPVPEQTISIPLNHPSFRVPMENPNIVLTGMIQPLSISELWPNGTRTGSVFVINEQAPAARGSRDEAFLFQVRLTLRYERGFVRRAGRQGRVSSEVDDRIADLHYRNHGEYAVGHNVSTDVVPPATPGAPVTTVHTTWLPQHEVRPVIPREEPGVLLHMEALADLAQSAPGAAQRELGRLPTAYGAWLDAQTTIPLADAQWEGTRDELLRRARQAQARIAAGIALLDADPQLLESFCLANRAMAMAARQRGGKRTGNSGNTLAPPIAPKWRLFQLAFLLLCLPGVVDETHEDRDMVDLIFFPTGGGKTEAYLGVIAVTLLLRRLRGQARPDGGLGVAVVLRYTLRLLTLDQLDRASTLVCALELLRQKQPHRLGSVRFAIGLWVGKGATANRLKDLAEDVRDFRSGRTDLSSPFPLANCPWCGGPLGPDALSLMPSQTKPEEVLVTCSPPSGEPPSPCAFSPRQNSDGLPILFVDEQIYRELPCFLLATVDKFAMLPWRGETGALFGRVSARAGRRFFGPTNQASKSATALPDGLPPPELIVQDELHLIAGPLGTMVGLYETVIDELASRSAAGRMVRPKVIASTATVRRADVQVRALFGRSVALFPPPAVNPDQTFFASPGSSEQPGRCYLGVAAPGQSLKAVLLRTYVTLLGAAARWSDDTTPDGMDPYSTLVGYFNSLRELGGMRRLVEDDVKKRTARGEDVMPEGHEGPNPWVSSRKINPPEELTSRERANRIKDTKAHLERTYREERHIDVLLASNMISVGVDIERLGLMVVAGQPKSTSEYIQATSRVGRKHPGLVVTCFNVSKPRDRSHYERFSAYHDAFYRYVEATSMTPFSGPALDRGLAGALFALARLGNPALTAGNRAMDVAVHPAAVAQAVAVFETRLRRCGMDAGSDALSRQVQARAQQVITRWTELVTKARENAGLRCYSELDENATGSPLLRASPRVPGADETFFAPRSMRDVEPTVSLWIERKKTERGLLE